MPCHLLDRGSINQSLLWLLAPAGLCYNLRIVTKKLENVDFEKEYPSFIPKTVAKIPRILKSGQVKVTGTIQRKQRLILLSKLYLYNYRCTENYS